MNEEQDLRSDFGDILGSPDLGQTGSDIANSFYTYVCSICHTSFSTMDSSVSNCIFCGEKSVTKEEGKSISDCSYLPFVMSIDDAFSNYKKNIRMNPLVPFSLRGGKIKKRIRKAYLPCSLFNIAVEGNITFYGAEKINKMKDVPMQTFESSYSTHFDYLNLLSSHFSKIGDAIVSNINNYQFDTKTNFESSILQDGYVIVGDIDKQQVVETVQKKTMKHCINIVKETIDHTLKKMADNHMAFGVSSTTTLFIPIYFINFRYKGHEYLYIMNGQTGETMIEVPTSTFNVILFSVLVFLFVVFIGCLIAYFL